MKQWLRFACSSVLVVGLLWLPKMGQAHAGPPYVKVNGKLAPTNMALILEEGVPFQQSGDVAMDPVVVNTAIMFDIDQAALGLDSSVPLVFKWQWSDNAQDATQGKLVSHTFKTTGSQIVTLFVKTETQGDFVQINTIQVDVIPKAGYQLPRVVVTREDENHGLTLNQSTIYHAKVTTDKSAKVKTLSWFTAPNDLVQGEAYTTKYTGDPVVVYHLVRAVDSHGLWATEALQAVISDQVVDVNRFSDQKYLTGHDNSNPSRLTIYARNPLVWIWTIAGIFVLGAVTLFLRSTRKHS